VTSLAKEKTSKVNDVAFIQKINEESEKYLLSNKIKESEETHIQRREEQLNSIKKKVGDELISKERAAKLKREELEIQRQLAIKEKEKSKKQKEDLFQERRSSMFKFKSPQTPKTQPKTKEPKLSLTPAKVLNFELNPLLKTIESSLKSDKKLQEIQVKEFLNPKVERIFNDLKTGIQNEQMENCRTALREFISLPDSKRGFEINFFVQEKIIDYLINLLTENQTLDESVTVLISKVILKASSFPEGSIYLVQENYFFEIYRLALKGLSNDAAIPHLSQLFEILVNCLQNYTNNELKWNLVWFISESGFFDHLSVELLDIHQLDQTQCSFVGKLLNFISQIFNVIETNDKKIPKVKNVLYSVITSFVNSSFAGMMNMLSQILKNQSKIIPQSILSISMYCFKILNSVFSQNISFWNEDCSHIQVSHQNNL
jgi:hypothetical protein